MSEQQSLKCVLPAHQAQTGARFSKYFISQGGTKEKQPDSQWELNITLMLRTYEKKWPSSGQKKKNPSSGQIWFCWNSCSHYQEVNVILDDKASCVYLKATQIQSQSQKDSSPWRLRASCVLVRKGSMNYSLTVVWGLLENKPMFSRNHALRELNNKPKPYFLTYYRLIPSCHRWGKKKEGRSSQKFQWTSIPPRLTCDPHVFIRDTTSCASRLAQWGQSTSRN